MNSTKLGLAMVCYFATATVAMGIEPICAPGIIGNCSAPAPLGAAPLGLSALNTTQRTSLVSSLSIRTTACELSGGWIQASGGIISINPDLTGSWGYPQYGCSFSLILARLGIDGFSVQASLVDPGPYGVCLPGFTENLAFGTSCDVATGRYSNFGGGSGPETWTRTSPGPSPTPSPAPSPSPSIYLLTLSSDKSEIYPSGVIGPYGDVQEDPLKSTARIFARLTDDHGVAVASKVIEFSSSGVELSGGHDHSGFRPSGAFYTGGGFTIKIQCITEFDGTCTVDYISSEVGGTEKISATALDMPSLTQTIDLKVRIPGLEELGPSDYYILDGGTKFHSLEHNHWGGEEARADATNLAKAFFDKHGKKMGINDMSLPWGGLFDIKGNWLTSHISHRRGMSVDFDRCVKLDGDEGPDEFSPCPDLKHNGAYISGYGLIKRQVVLDLCNKFGGDLVKEATYHCEF